MRPTPVGVVGAGASDLCAAGADNRVSSFVRMLPEIVFVLRRAVAADISAIQRVRRSVGENCLGATVISDEHVRDVIERAGRGWVIELEGEVVAFAIANAEDGNVWALFVHPDHEHRGYGRQLHDTMVEWLWAQGLDRLWLTTDPGTRAEGFYKSAGWQRVGVTDRGELRFKRTRDPASTVHQESLS